MEAICPFVLVTPSAKPPLMRILSTAVRLPFVRATASSVSAGRLRMRSSLMGVTASGERMRRDMARPFAAVASGVSGS